MEYQHPNNYDNIRRSQVFFDYNNRATLGCGTIILIILIVIIFGNMGSQDLQSELITLQRSMTDMQTSLTTQQSMIQSQTQRIDELHKKIDSLEEEINKLQNTLE